MSNIHARTLGKLGPLLDIVAVLSGFDTGTELRKEIPLLVCHKRYSTKSIIRFSQSPFFLTRHQNFFPQHWHSPPVISILA